MKGVKLLPQFVRTMLTRKLKLNNVFPSWLRLSLEPCYRGVKRLSKTEKLAKFRWKILKRRYY